MEEDDPMYVDTGATYSSQSCLCNRPCLKKENLGVYLIYLLICGLRAGDGTGFLSILSKCLPMNFTARSWQQAIVGEG